VLDDSRSPEWHSQCTGVGPVISDCIEQVGSGEIVCLTGVGVASNRITAEVAADGALKNKVAVGSVNANKRHWFKGGEALARADHNWLSRLISRSEKPENLKGTLEREPK
ncbi:MAG TPA: hypothetical protein VF783_07815, partial [Terriglobales bacterium]